MPSTEISIQIVNTIALHRAAMVADEAMFDDAGKLLHDEAAAEATLAAEIKAFRRFVECPCTSAADTQYKLDYLLTGDVGERERLMDRIAWAEEEGVNLMVFFRSLRYEPERSTTLTTSAMLIAAALGAKDNVISFEENQRKLAQVSAAGGSDDAA